MSKEEVQFILLTIEICFENWACTLEVSTDLSSFFRTCFKV